MNESEKEAMRADFAGMQFAFATMLRSLIVTHPNRVLLAQDLELQKQMVVAQLTPQLMPDRVLSSFHMTWDLVLPPVHGSAEPEEHRPKPEA